MFIVWVKYIVKGPSFNRLQKYELLTNSVYAGGKLRPDKLVFMPKIVC